MRNVVATILSLSISVPAIGAPTGIYFFGDSLTDVGNVTAVYGSQSHPPTQPTTVPGWPYDQLGGGKRASNGKLYADVLAEGLGFSASPAELGGNDYAFGGARTRYQTLGPEYDGILAQVNRFIAPTGPVDSGALYVLWGGSNNLQDILSGKPVDNNGLIPDAAHTIGDIAIAIGALYADGARKILVPNVADLSLVPRISERLGTGPAGDAGRAFIRNNVIKPFNAGLQTTLTTLESAYTGLDIIEFDTFANLDEIIANKSLYGISNTTGRCYEGDDLTFTGSIAHTPEPCANPDSYLWWDGIHPTSAVHDILGQRMLAALPEPGTLMLIAVALAAVRRQRSADATRLPLDHQVLTS